MEKIKTLFLALGSNLGDRHSTILEAYKRIEKSIGTILKKSDFYENEAVGFISENLFLNTCISVQTNLEPLDILKRIKLIEKELGKNVDSTIDGYVSRSIDIDIILYEDLVFEDKTLSIPHKSFRERHFVLFPLHSIAKSTIDPISHLTVNQLLKLNSNSKTNKKS